MTKERLFDILKNQGWDAHEYDDKIEISVLGPVIYDFSFTVTQKNPEKDIREYASSFSPDQLVRKWIVEHPEDDTELEKLTDDADGIEDMLLRLSAILGAEKDSRFLELLDELGWERIPAKDLQSNADDEIRKKLPSGFVVWFWLSHGDLENSFRRFAKEESDVEDLTAIFLDHREGSMTSFMEDMEDCKNAIDELAFKLDHPDEEYFGPETPTEKFINEILNDIANDQDYNKEPEKVAAIRNFQKSKGFKEFCRDDKDDIMDRIINNLSDIDYESYTRIIRDSLFDLLRIYVPEYTELMDTNALIL